MHNISPVFNVEVDGMGPLLLTEVLIHLWPAVSFQAPRRKSDDDEEDDE